MLAAYSSGRKEEIMSKSRLVKANEKLGRSLTHGFETIEKAVVGGYTKSEDRFVDKYLTEEDEAVEEAKIRLHRTFGPHN